MVAADAFWIVFRFIHIFSAILWVGSALFLGLFQIKPTVDKMSALGAEIESAGGPPQPEQVATMQRLTERFHALGRRDLIPILIAAATMVTARFW